MRPFIIYGLPRSRTLWLSRFLSYRDWHCGHDEMRHARSLDDVRAWFGQASTGTVETAAMPWWRLVQQMRPDIRTVVVRRPVDEVLHSLMSMGLPFDAGMLARGLRGYDRKLDQIERRVPGVLSVSYADLASEQACACVFEHCLPYRHDPVWWRAFDQLNLQGDMLATLRYYHAFEPQLLKLAKMARHVAIAGMRKPVAEIDGMTIGQEPFESFYRDSQPLFSEHLMEVGEAPDNFVNKNVALMRRLDEQGALQVTTARSNGRVFGYLMTIMSPALDAVDAVSAFNLTFYASKAAPGLGMKLQRSSIEALKRRRVKELFFRAGERGSGPRLDIIYRRLGAEEFGRMYKLELGAA